MQRVPGEPERRGVEEHVGGVGQQREGVGQEPAGHLDEHEAGDEHEGAADDALVLAVAEWRVCVVVCHGRCGQRSSRAISATAAMPASSEPPRA
jgi:hypothetical protein